MDAGYLGLARDFPGQVKAPPKKPGTGAAPEELAVWEEARHQQSSERICVEPGHAEHKQWRPLQRWIGHREYCDETHLAIAGLVSDRAAERRSPTRRLARSPGPTPHRAPRRNRRRPRAPGSAGSR